MSKDAVLIEFMAMFQHLPAATEIRHENLRYYRRPSGRDLKVGPPEYKMTHLTTGFLTKNKHYSDADTNVQMSLWPALVKLGKPCLVQALESQSACVPMLVTGTHSFLAATRFRFVYGMQNCVVLALNYSAGHFFFSKLFRMLSKEKWSVSGCRHALT